MDAMALQRRKKRYQRHWLYATFGTLLITALFLGAATWFVQSKSPADATMTQAEDACGERDVQSIQWYNHDKGEPSIITCR